MQVVNGRVKFDAMCSYPDSVGTLGWAARDVGGSVHWKFCTAQIEPPLVAEKPQATRLAFGFAMFS